MHEGEDPTPASKSTSAAEAVPGQINSFEARLIDLLRDGLSQQRDATLQLGADMKEGLREVKASVEKMDERVVQTMQTIQRSHSGGMRTILMLAILAILAMAAVVGVSSSWDGQVFTIGGK